jgi:hypothetical protein
MRRCCCAPPSASWCLAALVHAARVRGAAGSGSCSGLLKPGSGVVAVMPGSRRAALISALTQLLHSPGATAFLLYSAAITARLGHRRPALVITPDGRATALVSYCCCSATRCVGLPDAGRGDFDPRWAGPSGSAATNTRLGTRRLTHWGTAVKVTVNRYMPCSNGRCSRGRGRRARRTVGSRTTSSAPGRPPPEPAAYRLPARWRGWSPEFSRTESPTGLAVLSPVDQRDRPRAQGTARLGPRRVPAVPARPGARPQSRPADLRRCCIQQFARGSRLRSRNDGATSKPVVALITRFRQRPRCPPGRPPHSGRVASQAHTRSERRRPAQLRPARLEDLCLEALTTATAARSPPRR